MRKNSGPTKQLIGHTKIYKYIGTNIYELKTEDTYDEIRIATLFLQENAHSSVSPLLILISKSSSNGCRHIGHLFD